MSYKREVELNNLYLGLSTNDSDHFILERMYGFKDGKTTRIEEKELTRREKIIKTTDNLLDNRRVEIIRYTIARDRLRILLSGPKMLGLIEPILFPKSRNLPRLASGEFDNFPNDPELSEYISAFILSGYYDGTKVYKSSSNIVRTLNEILKPIYELQEDILMGKVYLGEERLLFLGDATSLVYGGYSGNIEVSDITKRSEELVKRYRA